MKLAKTLIVSGLLFSSILGSVNVGSITAMAADIKTFAEVPNNNKFEVIVNYIVDNESRDKPDGAKGKISVDPKVDVTKTDLGLNDNYKIINGESLRPQRNEANKSYSLTVNLETKKEIKINYKLGDEVVGQASKVTTITAFPSDAVKESQLNIDSKYKIKDGSNLQPVKGSDGIYSLTVNLEEKTPTPAPGHPQTPTKPAPSKRPSGARYTIQRVRIEFVDQNSKDIVGYKQVTGKSSFSTKIEAPKNYSFANEKDATIKFDKKGNKEIKIFVKKMTAAPIMHKGIVTTTNGSYKRLYTLEGKMITNRAISGSSKWYTDQYATVNGEKMYRVATNEWVKASDVQ